MIQQLLWLFLSGLGLALIGFVMYLVHLYYDDIDYGGWDE